MVNKAPSRLYPNKPSIPPSTLSRRVFIWRNPLTPQIQVLIEDLFCSIVRKCVRISRQFMSDSITSISFPTVAVNRHPFNHRRNLKKKGHPGRKTCFLPSPSRTQINSPLTLRQFMMTCSLSGRPCNKLRGISFIFVQIRMQHCLDRVLEVHHQSQAITDPMMLIQI